jgi:octaprenyl-diphosphate synthase
MAHTPSRDSTLAKQAANGHARRMSAKVVSLPQRPDANQPSLAPILGLTATAMNAVNAIILDRMQSEIPLIPALAGHLIAGGGKRMRPMLTLAGAELVGYQGTRHHRLAASVEFIHTATLLHDDVVDGSETRRGKEAANLVFGNPATVLVGDFLFSRAFELMVEDGSLKVLKILSSASAIIAQGEVDQLTAQRKIETSEERYLDIIGAKTAALFAAASRISAVVAECAEAEERALDDYGRNLGIAFQLVDDAIDYDSSTAEMGKDSGDDFREGKMTLPVILAYARGSAEERRFWEEAIAGFRTEDEDLAHAVDLIRQHDCVTATRARARHYAERACDALSIFPDSSARRAMVEAARFAVSRGY